MSLLFLVGVCSAASALAVSFPWLVITNLLLGFFTIIPQILVPFAAGLANDRNRGKVLGNVAIGLVCGILGASGQRGDRCPLWLALNVLDCLCSSRHHYVDHSLLLSEKQRDTCISLRKTHFFIISAFDQGESVKKSMCKPRLHVRRLQFILDDVSVYGE